MRKGFLKLQKMLESKLIAYDVECNFFKIKQFLPQNTLPLKSTALLPVQEGDGCFSFNMLNFIMRAKAIIIAREPEK